MKRNELKKNMDIEYLSNLETAAHSKHSYSEIKFIVCARA